LTGLTNAIHPRFNGISLTPLFSVTPFASTLVRGVAVVQYPAYCCRKLMSYGLRGTRWRYVAHLESPTKGWPRTEIKSASVCHDEIDDMVSPSGEDVSWLGIDVNVAALAEMRLIFLALSVD